MIHAGDLPDVLYYIISGSVEVMIEDEEGNEMVLAYLNRGVAWRRKGGVARALADLNDAIRLDPANARAYNERGLAWTAKGDVEQAIADYSESLRHDPTNAGAYLNRGNAYDRKGEREQNQPRAVRPKGQALRVGAVCRLHGRLLIFNDHCPCKCASFPR